MCVTWLGGQEYRVFYLQKPSRKYFEKNNKLDLSIIEQNITDYNVVYIWWYIHILLRE